MFTLTEENTATVMDDEVAQESSALFINIARVWAIAASSMFWLGYWNHTQ
jgi:hypothetical protein